MSIPLLPIQHFSFPIMLFIAGMTQSFEHESNIMVSGWDSGHTTYFSASLCEVNLKMTINNSSDNISSVHIKTFDAPSGHSLSINAAPAAQPGLPLENQEGWCDLPTANDTKIITGKALAARFAKSFSLASVSQFIWSGWSFTKFVLQPRSTVEIPLQICVFTPGIYDLSNYSLNWNLVAINDEENQKGAVNKSCGVCQGYPYHLAVLQSNLKYGILPWL